MSKTVRIGNKTTTKTIEKIGTYDEIKEKCGDMDPLDWAKQYAAKRSKEEKSFFYKKWQIRRHPYGHRRTLIISFNCNPYFLHKTIDRVYINNTCSFTNTFDSTVLAYGCNAGV